MKIGLLNCCRQGFEAEAVGPGRKGENLGRVGVGTNAWAQGRRRIYKSRKDREMTHVRG